jgi:toxin ParE1/3/4
MPRIAWRRRAQADLRNVFLWLLDRNPSAAWRTYHAIRDHITVLPVHPGLGRQGRVDHTRELVIPPTPNTVVHTIDAAGDVIILGIVHGAQRWPQQLD